LYSIVGGKLTTHRALAEDVLGVLRGQLPGLERIRPTRNRPLPGSLAPKERGELLADVGAQLGMEQATRLWHVYGGAARRIAELAREDAELAVVLGGSSVLVAELAHSWNAEWASTLDDFLQRRCMAGLDADFGLGAAESAASWMVRLGIADAARAKSELEDYRALAARRCAPRAG
jgi:glycerol-3-phosphate dehydrogenase